MCRNCCDSLFPAVQRSKFSLAFGLLRCQLAADSEHSRWSSTGTAQGSVCKTSVSFHDTHLQLQTAGKDALIGHDLNESNMSAGPLMLCGFLGRSASSPLVPADIFFKDFFVLRTDAAVLRFSRSVFSCGMVQIFFFSVTTMKQFSAGAVV